MKTDILIIGGGLTALAAADTAIRESGMQVDLLQCGSGASPHIHGFCMPLGEGDSQELLLKDTLESGGGQCDPALAARLCSGCLELMDYFRELGLDVDRDGEKPRLLHALGSSVPRIAGIENATGPAVMRQLRRRLASSGCYREHGHQRGLKLLVKDGRVIGVRCLDMRTGELYNYYAKCVVLATGGFSRIFGESTNSSEMGGDGIAMAHEIGARLTDLEFIQFEPCAAVWPEKVAGKGIITTMFYNGAVLRGKNGNRFMLQYGEKAECVSKDVLSRCIAQEILDHGATEHGGVYFDATGVPEELWQTVYAPYLQRYLHCGIDLRTTPVEIAPAAHTSCGGVVIDPQCRTGIPGLIACGEVTGGLHGANRLGGNAGLETMVFGRVAGAAAAAEVQDVVLPEEDERTADAASDIALEPMRKHLQEALRMGLGVIRSQETMRMALEQVSALLDGLGDCSFSSDKIRLHHDMLTAKLTLQCALARGYSVGCHIRSDSIVQTPYRLTVRYDTIRQGSI